MTNSADPDQLASEEANWSGSALFAIKYVNLHIYILIYAVCKGRVYPGSARLGLRQGACFFVVFFCFLFFAQKSIDIFSYFSTKTYVMELKNDSQMCSDEYLGFHGETWKIFIWILDPHFCS